MTKADLLIRRAHLDPRVTGGVPGDAVAVAGGRILAVGPTDALADLATPDTRVIDLAGASLLPGFQDAHVHPVIGGVELGRVDLAGVRSVDEFLATIGRWAAAHPEAEWIRGWGWTMELFPHGLARADLLGDITGGRPLFLPVRDGHSALVNDEALRRAGITRETPDPPDGRIERDPDGTPTGMLHEGAMTLVSRLLPATSAQEIREGLLRAQRYLHSLGITAWQDAAVGEDVLGLGISNYEVYRDLAASGELTATVVGALWWDRDHGIEQLESLRELRSGVPAGGRFRPTSVKMMMDGILETYTASMLEPYHGIGHAHAHPTGLRFIDARAVRDYVVALDRDGFQVHFHVIGDRAVRDALDAVQAARDANGFGGRHHLAHLQVVDPADVARFAALRVVANAQPLWACNTPQVVELTNPFLGEERAGGQYPWRTLVDAGARLAMGSDWPISTPDVLEQLYVAVTRKVPPSERTPGWGLDDTPFFPQQCLTAAEAVQAFTVGSAYVNGRDEVSGTIEVGKEADLVAVDTDLFTCDPEAIPAATVLLTVAGGRIVHEGQ
jgi:predicted amidohydrolase YtcJ